MESLFDGLRLASWVARQKHNMYYLSLMEELQLPQMAVRANGSTGVYLVNISKARFSNSSFSSSSDSGRDSSLTKAFEHVPKFCPWNAAIASKLNMTLVGMTSSKLRR